MRTVYVSIPVSIYIYNAHHAPVLEAKQRDVLDLQRRDKLLLHINISHIAFYIYVFIPISLHIYMRKTNFASK